MKVASWTDIGRMDKLGRLDSPVHRLDARAKAIVTMVFIIVIMSFPRHEVSALAPFVLFPVALLSLGNIPSGYILRKIALASPFALAVGVFNPVFDRQMILVGGYSVAGGWLSFASIMIRFGLTVGAALTLVACSGIHRLCAGLERMGLPRVFAVQLLLFYRYLFVVADEGSRMARGLKIRTSGSYRIPLRVYGSLLGNLLLRSMDRAQRVYQAMISRGFDGVIRVPRKTRVKLSDLVFFVGWVTFFAAARIWNLSEWIGHLFTA